MCALLQLDAPASVCGRLHNTLKLDAVLFWACLMTPPHMHTLQAGMLWFLCISFDGATAALARLALLMQHLLLQAAY
jgi:hypothetical protein